jgi:molybdopterin/thiamine biosynthesis adenylyltransferase
MENKIIAEILKAAALKSFPDGTAHTSISLKDIETLSKTYKISGREIEIAALEKNIIPERYVRNMKHFSTEEQTILLKSQVSVVGLGGLGGTATEILARAGIGILNLIDGDRFEENNLNRQLLSTQKLLLKSKVEAAIDRIQEINSSIVVNKHHEYLDEGNTMRLLEKSDVIVDCLDNIKSRLILEGASKKIQSPLVSAAVGGVWGHVTTIFPEDTGLSQIYGGPASVESKGAEASLGCLPYAVTLLASIECSEVIKILLNKGSVLRNQLLVVDLMSNIFDIAQLT